MVQMGVAEKILREHLVEGKFEPGTEIALKIDQTLTQDATGTMTYLQFESLGIPNVKTELSVSYVDHNTLQEGYENADDHNYLKTVAAKYGILYSRAGNGICHQVHLERFGKPGKTLLGSDSHTPTCGGIGMIAIGSGGIDVALAMGGAPFYLTCPKIVKVNLTGKLSPWVSAKDVILTLLKMLTTKGNVGIILEYGGEGVKELSIPERATITNMGAELGVTTSVFPSDIVTCEFLRAQGRDQDWKEIVADKDAKYEKVIDLDLSKIVPMAAQPHSPDNVCTIEEVAGKQVNQIGIGSCTNSSYKDLMTVAKILEDKKISPDVSLIIAPGSRQVLKMISNNGALSTMISAGARIMETTCGFCIGSGQSPQTKGISLRTTNRNFKGRSGTESAEVYLISPETAAVSALTGKITDPRKAGIAYPEIKTPVLFDIDDSMIVVPPSTDKRSAIEISRGPNIGSPLKTEKLEDKIVGEITLKVADKITTDHIMPAGSKLKYRSNIQKYSEFVFEGVDATFSKRAMENKDKAVGNIVVAGLSYGQGSSREHAAICPRHLGVRAIVAKSFERIHFANLINFGILPLTFVNPDDYDKIEKGDSLEIINLMKSITENKNIVLVDKTKNIEIQTNCNLSGRQKEIIFAGGILNYAGKK